MVLRHTVHRNRKQHRGVSVAALAFPQMFNRHANGVREEAGSWGISHMLSIALTPLALRLNKVEPAIRRAEQEHAGEPEQQPRLPHGLQLSLPAMDFARLN